jgi:hypothetical protein
VTKTRHGGCQCGEIRYAISAEPLSLYVCHCRECQKQSASGFGMSLAVRRESFQIVQGEPGRWQRVADSGRIVSAAFCRTCGSRLYHEPQRNPEILNIKAGTLDDMSDLTPVGHLWAKNAQPWLRPAVTGLVFEGQPDSFEPFFAAWTERASA